MQNYWWCPLYIVFSDVPDDINAYSTIGIYNDEDKNERNPAAVLKRMA